MKALQIYKKYGMYVLLAVEIVVFGLLAPNFLTTTNIFNVLRQVSMLGIASCGLTFVILSGGMDLSIGAQIALVGLLGGLLMTPCTGGGGRRADDIDGNRHWGDQRLSQREI